MRYLILLCIITLILLTFLRSSNAQVNTERIRNVNLEEGIHNRLKFDFNLVSGNSDFFSLTGGHRTDFVSGNLYIFGVVQYQRQIEGDEDFINKGFLHLRGIRLLSDRVSAEVFVQKEFDDFILILDRNLIGGGLRINLLSTNATDQGARLFSLYGGIGTMWENEEIDTQPVSETRFYRSTNYISMNWQADERVNLGTTAYYQVRYQDFDDYRILFEIGLGFDLTRSIAFQTSFNLRYDNDPPDGIEKYDIDINNGMGFTF